MKSLEVIARPHFNKADLAWLTDIRSRRAGSRGAPFLHWSSPASAPRPPPSSPPSHLHQGALPATIRFRLRSALVVPEPALGRFHVFLIPDEGFGAILKLHDALHVGPVAAGPAPGQPLPAPHHRRHDPDYASARDLALRLEPAFDRHPGRIDALEVEPELAKSSSWWRRSRFRSKAGSGQGQRLAVPPAAHTPTVIPGRRERSD